MAIKKGPKTTLKRGKLSQEEESYIAKHKERMTAEQMAMKLRRPSMSVENFLKKLSPLKPASKRDMKLADELETRPEWANFREQFDAKELDHFKYRYVQLMGQFQEDIMPTEEMHIFQVISLDILVSRTMKESKEVGDFMRTAHLAIGKLQVDLNAATDPMSISDLNKQVMTAEAKYAKAADQLKGLSQRYESYMMRQSAMLKELKGTRDQRVKVWENSKQSFLGYLRLLNEEDQLIAVGREAGLMQAAAQVEEERLRTPHTYADGTMDQPLLTPEDVRDY